MCRVWKCCTYLRGRHSGQKCVVLAPLLDAGSLLMGSQLWSFDDVVSQLGALVEGVDDVVKSEVACMTKWSMSIFDTMKSLCMCMQQ
jgi:hypothetical protein